MPRNDIGGFFVSLGMNIDKNSFETGNRLIDNVGNSFNKLIGSARNAAVVLAGTALATGAIESQTGKLAEEIGISTEALELWKATAKIAGVDANGLVGAMNNVATVLQRMRIDGSGLEDFAKKLGELGIVTADFDIEKMLNLSPDELMKEVYKYAHEALKGGADKNQVQQIIKDILGKEGMQLFIDIERRGMTIDQALGEADKRVYTNTETNANAQDFMTEVRLLKQASESMTKLLGSEVADQLTEYVKSINDWIDLHGNEIASGIKTVADGVGKLVGKLVDFVTDDKVQDAAKTAGGAMLDSATSALNTIQEVGSELAEGDIVGAVKAGAEGFVNTVVEPTDKVVGILVDNNETLSDYKEQTGQNNTETVVNAGARSIPGYKWLVHGVDWLSNKMGIMSDEDYETNTNIVKGKKKMKDGIMRPDGTVTQVAPDDWVIAARNIGDLARAFTPQNHTAVSAGEYTINQTFNISGGNDMPQVLRQQAYHGTQEGLLEVMNESSRRMQLMSGTR